VGIQVAPRSNSAPPLMVFTVRNTHRLSAGTEYHIGRNPGSDFELADARVSWDHAVLYTEGPTWVLEDRGSRNGTYLGTERIGRLEITGPCVVHFGNAQDGQVLRFELQQFEPPPSTPESPWGTGMDSVFLPGVDREPTSRIRLQQRVIKIGRRPDNDVVVTDLGVSKQHAELRLSPTGRYQIIDLGSHNGTFVNGVRVNQPAEITESDIVSIGRATFRLADGVLTEYIDEGKIEFEAHELLVRVNDGGKQKVLLEGITFTLPERSMMAVIGPAGAGKSTLLNALTGKRQADEGRVLYDYRDLYDSYDELKHRIGLVPQQSVTHDQLTAKTALGYAAELRFPSDAGEAERTQRVDEVLGELDMTQHAGTRIDRLSGGQQKRVNIGIELLTKPSLLFLDEPTSPLDPHLKRELFDRMRKMADKAAEQGQSVVVITHDVESKLIDQCDRLIVLVPGGKMAYFGPPREGLSYFGKEDWADAFADFAAYPGRDWAGEFRSSAACAKYVTTPMADRLNQPLPQRRPEDEKEQRHQRGRMPQVFTMARRYARVMSVDRGYIIFAALLPLILGGLVRLMSGSTGLGGPAHTNVGAETVLLILVMAACLSGTANSIREFIKEREIFERERMAGLSAGAYLGSKVVVLGVISVIQAIFIVIVGLAGTKMGSTGAAIPGPAIIEIAIGAAALCVVSMLLGLVVSVLVTKGDQTMPALVVLIMLQVVLSGGVLALSAGVETWVSYVAPARWGLGAIASTINLNVIGVTKPDAMWVHSSTQWLKDMAVLVAMGLVFLIIAQIRLTRIGPHRRK
jgi:ABC-type multidrug transport system ATPase subunit/pSer/pThr/pTyr-binding forkhead associated (FHA) protein